MYHLDEKLQDYIHHNYELCREHADYITDHPECGGQEVLACQRYAEILRTYGYEVESPYKGVPHSFRAVKKERSGRDMPRALLMCEYDALPEIGHACGHSLSGSASLLAGLALNEAYPDLPLRVDIMGTPGEEFPGGKAMLAEAGAFEGYEFAAMAHMFDANAAQFNVLACNDRQICFRGKAAHASSNPADGRNALNAARLFMDAMDMLRQHMPSQSQFHGIVTKGGELPSIVPDDVRLDFYFRARTLKDLCLLNETAERCVRAAALAMDCEGEYSQRYLTYADLSNPPAAAQLIGEIFDAMGEKVSVFQEPQGSTDAGNVDQLIPVFHPLVSISGGKKQALHDRAFAALAKSENGYRGMFNAGILLGNLILRLVREPEKLEAVQRWHREYRKNSSPHLSSSPA
ncbi:MAG TPA: peptidase dimerization domain-containing protein [Candidatus Mailhella merdavium]|nr:peptidase dimerization domain-containing protein [Candidatus Mailhella merdavium]